MKNELKELKKYRYTHRGFYDNQQIPENSLPAFQRTKERGWGSELDIHLMKDGNLAVIHDSCLQRMTGDDVNIEDLTRKDLEKYTLGQSEEHIPLFEDVLALQIPLIVELKTAGGNHAELGMAAWERLKNYPAPWCVESFDPRAMAWFAKNHPEVVRGQLSQNFYKCPEVAVNGFMKFVLSRMLLNFLSKPDFIAYKYDDRSCRALKRSLQRGKQEVSWTIRSKADLLAAEAAGSIPIFEKFDPEED